MAPELMLLGTAGAPLPVAGRGGTFSALLPGNRRAHGQHRAGQVVGFPAGTLTAWGA